MKDPLKLIDALNEIYNLLDDIKYERKARVCYLDEEEMSTVFYCRDTAYLTRKNYLENE
jgi:hypothetical protein